MYFTINLPEGSSNLRLDSEYIGAFLDVNVWVGAAARITRKFSPIFLVGAVRKNLYLKSALVRIAEGVMYVVKSSVMRVLSLPNLV